MNKLAERLKHVRKEKGLSQNALAKLLNVTQPAVAKWESGTREPSLDDLISLANVLGETTDFLLGRKDF